ncbi:MAG: hypothetical protein Q8Q23_00850 [bacterium]|nr:hypothetical protein [bacterium]
MENFLNQEYRCLCGKLLFKGLLIDSEIEIKCKGCREIRKIKGVSGDKLICKKINCPNRV